MSNRIDRNEIITIALLYREKYIGLNYIYDNQLEQFIRIVNDNLDNMKSNISYYNKSNSSKIYYTYQDEFGFRSYKLNNMINFHQAWINHIDNLPMDIINACEMNNALNVIDLEINDNKITKKREKTKKIN